ncbi:hypothetical protein SUDANB145_00365 [Streptomyces sp. enrichment culture]|uniref:hypothetical protein n=1 Tax=Streptomyces sp. enrichment culture TaxID=1795815 RepID=UPI003F574F0D
MPAPQDGADLLVHPLFDIGMERQLVEDAGQYVLQAVGRGPVAAEQEERVGADPPVAERLVRVGAAGPRELGGGRLLPSRIALDTVVLSTTGQRSEPRAPR